MAEIKKITLPTGNTYDLVDAGARELIAQMAGSTSMMGVTTTALTDGATTNPISIDGANKQAYNGDMAIYNNKEFVWTASIFDYWEKHTNSQDKFYYSKISNPSSSVTDEAVYVRKTYAELNATQTTPLDDALGGGATYLKAEATNTANYGKWNEFGDLSALGSMAYKNTTDLNFTKGGGDIVLGKDTTLTVPAHTATASGGGTATVLTSDTTANLTSGAVTVNPTTVYVGGTATAPAFTPTTTNHKVENCITGYSGGNAHQVVTGVSGVQKYLETTKEYLCGSATVTANKSNWDFTVQNGVLSITGGNGSDVVAATRKSSQTQLATGVTTDTAGDGDLVITNIPAANITKESLASIMGTATTKPVISSDTGSTGTTFALVSGGSVAAPTITLSTGQSGTGKVQVMTGVASASVGTGVTINKTGATATALTSIGTITIPAQTVTKGDNDEVDVAVFEDIDFTIS